MTSLTEPFDAKLNHGHDNTDKKLRLNFKKFEILKSEHLSKHGNKMGYV